MILHSSRQFACLPIVNTGGIVCLIIPSGVSQVTSCAKFHFAFSRFCFSSAFLVLHSPFCIPFSCWLVLLAAMRVRRALLAARWTLFPNTFVLASNVIREYGSYPDYQRFVAMQMSDHNWVVCIVRLQRNCNTSVGVQKTRIWNWVVLLPWSFVLVHLVSITHS